MLWIGPNREIVGAGAAVSNETLADVDDLCLAARDHKLSDWEGAYDIEGLEG